MGKKIWTKAELDALGITEENVVDSTRHPAVTAVSWDAPANTRQFLGAKWQYTHHHVRPQSILIVTIGNLWEENAWWRLQDMLLHTARAGYSVSLEEVTDNSLFSFEAIPLMRWSASMLARDGGVEWLLMVDNDALVEKDTLLRLLRWDRPVVFPRLEDLEQKYPEIIAPLADPTLEEGHGLVPVRWAAMSVMLFNVKLFNVLDPTAWRGNDYVFSQALNFLGHRIYVDTDTAVKVVKGPARHVSKGYDEFWESHRKMRERLKKEPRDRRPPPNFNPETDDGMVDAYGTYFAIPNKIARQTPEQAATKEKLWVP